MIIIMIMIIMNMQKNLYTIQFFSPPDDRFAASPRAATTESRNCRFCAIPEKFKLLDKGRFEFTEARKADSLLPLASPHS